MVSHRDRAPGEYVVPVGWLPAYMLVVPAVKPLGTTANFRAGRRHNYYCCIRVSVPVLLLPGAYRHL